MADSRYSNPNDRLDARDINGTLTPTGTRVAWAMAYLQQQYNMTPEVAAGVVGNWLQENPNLNPEQGESKEGMKRSLDYQASRTAKDMEVSAYGQGGYSLPQFTTRERKNKAAEALAAITALSPDLGSFQTALRIAGNEIVNDYPEMLNRPSVPDAALWGLKNYEGPEDQGAREKRERVASAWDAYGLNGYDPAAVSTPGYGPKSVYDAPSGVDLGGGLGDRQQSAGMSFTPALPAPMQGLPDPMAPMAPGYNFSQSFGGLGYNPQFAQPVTPQNPPAATQPGWGSIAGNAIGAARTYDPLSSISPPTFATPRNELPGASPDWGNAGLGGGFGDFTTGSNGTFQKAPPSVMSAPEPGPTGGSIAGAALRQFAPEQVSAIPQFSNIKPSMAAVTAAVAAADEEAAKSKALAEAYTPPSARDDMYGVAPTAEPATTATPKAPQVQKVMPRIAPKPVPIQPAVPTTPQGLAKYGLGDRPMSPGEALSQQIGTPDQFMGSGTSAKDFAKAVTAVAAINGNDDAKSYAAQLYSNRPEIQGVAFDALQNEYAKATQQMGVPTLYDRFAAATGFGTPNQLPFYGIGASNSPAPQQGMWTSNPDGSGRAFVNYSADQQRALQNSGGLLGALGNAFGIGAGANNGWGPSGSMGYGPGTSGLW